MFHTLIVLGNVGRDPEMRFTPSGQAVTTFSLATNRNTKNQAGEWVKEPIWFRVSTFGKEAERCNQYLHKGSRVIIEGHLRSDSSGNPRVYQRQDGSYAASYEVNAQRVTFVSTKTESSSESGGTEEMGEIATDNSEDNIPF